jgi:hypothetical protein
VSDQHSTLLPINRHDLTVEVVTAGHGTVVPLPGQEVPPAVPSSRATYVSPRFIHRHSFRNVPSFVLTLRVVVTGVGAQEKAEKLRAGRLE